MYSLDMEQLLILSISKPQHSSTYSVSNPIPEQVVRPRESTAFSSKMYSRFGQQHLTTYITPPQLLSVDELVSQSPTSASSSSGTKMFPLAMDPNLNFGMDLMQQFIDRTAYPMNTVSQKPQRPPS